MKVYVTKYALTRGIEVVEVQEGSAGSKILVGDKYVYTMGRYPQQFIMDKNAFLTYEEAAVAARAMRDKKEVSIRKQLAKVRGLVFPTNMPMALRSPAKED